MRRSLGVRHDREAQLDPPVEAPQQRPHILIPSVVQEARHPGAAGLVRSSAIHDHGPSFRDFRVPALELAGRNVNRARNLLPAELIAQVGA